jgi:hypothetical protein
MTNHLGRTPFGFDGISNGVHRRVFQPHEPMLVDDSRKAVTTIGGAGHRGCRGAVGGELASAVPGSTGNGARALPRMGASPVLKPGEVQVRAQMRLEVTC